jgi:hypothetical protein
MKKLLALGALLAAAAVAASCSSGSSTGPDMGTGTGPGGGTQSYTLRVNLTDAPMMGLSAVNVTIASLRVHQSASAAPGDPGWMEIPVTAQMPVDLMRYRNGTLYELCRIDLGPGTYQQVRLQLMPNAGATGPYRNFVMDMGGVTRPIDVPGDSIKIVHPFTVAAGTKTDLTLDFDAAQSCRQRGNGTWFMQPVIRPSSTTN